jgi:hypothetical protein
MNNDFEFDLLIKKMAAEHQAELPSSGVVWWRAQILKKQADQARIERPVKIMQALAAIICLVVVAGLWISQADGIRGAFSGNIFPFAPFLIAGAVIGIGFIGLMLWSTSRFKNQT